MSDCYNSLFPADCYNGFDMGKYLDELAMEEAELAMEEECFFPANCFHRFDMDKFLDDRHLAVGRKARNSGKCSRKVRKSLKARKSLMASTSVKASKVRTNVKARKVRKARSAEAELSVEVERFLPDIVYRGYSYLDDRDVAVVRIGRNPRTIVEATYACSKAAARQWLRTVTGELRRCRRHLVAGLCVFRGRSRPRRPLYVDSRRPLYWESRRRPDPIGAFVLCLGGSHVLIYHPDRFFDVRPGRGHLVDLLSNSRLAACSVGAAAAAEQLQEEWGIHVELPVEVGDLAVEAYGEQTVVEVERGVKKLMGLPGLPLENLALVVLTREMRMGKWPTGLVQEAKSWAAYGGVTAEAAMYAARDAFLCFQIGLKFVHKVGVKRLKELYRKHLEELDEVSDDEYY